MARDADAAAAALIAFFPEPGAHAHLRDVPDAELHLLDTGHFALETRLPQIGPLIDGFLDRAWRPIAARKRVDHPAGRLHNEAWLKMPTAATASMRCRFIAG
ncbi:hypothetical protein GCM10010191_62140 [Actinomadura vinacea]|uniref:Uncharacterized protein n=1 Tax=Actinomadura vinacea TaxID=115336 RepID=A0ABN3JUJ9_9ACTN